MRMIKNSTFKTLLLVAASGLLAIGCSEDDATKTEPVIEALLLDCADITVPTVLKNRGAGVDYIWPCYKNIEASLIIEPGVTIAFEEGAGMRVSDYGSRTGSLYAVGTEALPIVFTSVNKTPGAWKNIEFSSSRMDNKLQHCVIEYAGNNDGQLAALSTESLYNSKVEIKNTAIRNNKGIGVSIWKEANIEGWSTNTISNNGGYPLEIAPNKVRFLDGAQSTYTNNVKNQINVYSRSVLNTKRGYITAVDGPTHTWVNPGVPFHVSEFLYVTENGHLRIMEGCQITFGQEYGLAVQGEGEILEVLGTESKPVHFSGLFGAGSWKGISIENSNSNDNKIQNATIADAGQSSWNWWLTSAAAISLGFPTPKNVKLQLKNVHIKNSGGCGIAMKNNINLSGLIFEGVTYGTNAGSDVCTQD